MLTIRAKQMEALGRARTEDFLRRLQMHLRALLPTCADPEGEARRGLRMAATFGLETEAEVAAFVEITCRHFGTIPEGDLPRPALAVLMTYGLEPVRKLARYREWTEGHANTTIQ